MKTTICKQFRFEAAHQIPGHEGKCARPHGHSYLLEVFVEGSINTETGMVMDFEALSNIVKEKVIDGVDHQNLNALKPSLLPTTAEVLALAFFVKLCIFIPGLSRVRLWETSTCYAEVSVE